MKRWQALAALAGLFALGVASGALGAHLYYARALDRPHGPPPVLGPFMGQRLERILELSPEQESEVRRIMEESRREMERLRRDLAPQLHEAMERNQERIRELLTPEQQRRFDELRRAHRHRAERYFGHRRGHRPPPPGHRPPPVD